MSCALKVTRSLVGGGRWGQAMAGAGHMETLRWENIAPTRSREKASVSAGWRVKG